MSLPGFSVRNSLLVNLLSLFVVLAGAVSFFTLRREAFPNISFDIVEVRTHYPGATPEEVEKLITRPIEKELRALSDIEEIQSASAEGLSYIALKMDPDAADKSRVVTDIQNAVSRVSDLPADLEKPPLAREIETKNYPIVEVALSGPMSRKELQDIAEALEKRLEDLSEVAAIGRNGWREEQIWIELDVGLLQRHKVSIDEVVASVHASNVNVPGGTLDTGEREMLIRTLNQIETPEEADEIVIRASETGKALRVRDVGRSRWTFEDASTITRTDGQDALRLVVIKKEDGDAIRMVNAVMETVDAFRETVREDLDVAYINDFSFFIRRRIGILYQNGWISLTLVVLSLFMLLNARAATWTAAGIVVAVGAALWVMNLLGLSINLISMFGMIMVLGLLVDDAIVVVENIYRHMEQGTPRREAAVRAASEVAKPVTATVLTTVVAFLPLAYMSGIMGKFIRQIPYVVIITLIVSLIECIAVMPSHIADFGGNPRKNRNDRKGARAIIFDRAICAYTRYLSFFIRRRYLTALVSLSIIGSGIYLGFRHIPIEMFPKRGIEIFFLRVEAPIGTSLEETARRMERLESLVAKLPPNELKNYVTVAGIIAEDDIDPFTQRGSHVGQIIVFLTPDSDRDRTSEEIAGALRPEIEAVPGFTRTWISQVGTGPPEGKPVSIRIRGPDFAVLDAISSEVKAALARKEGVRDIKSDYEPGKDEIRFSVDGKSTASAGLTPAAVARTIRWAFEGEVATVIRKGEREIDVVVRLDEASRSQSATFDRLFVRNPAGFHVPLSSVSMRSKQAGLAVIKHFDGKRVVNVTADVDTRSTTSYEVNAGIQERFRDLPARYPGYDLTAGGEYEDTRESLETLGRAFVLAAAMIFLILASTFNSLIQPMIIMLTIPFGIFAALLALGIHGQPLSFLALLGMVGLAGVAVNQAIVLIEFVNVRRRENIDRVEAILEAARMRFRPVVLTTVTTVLGLTPVAYGFGGKDPFLVPMALTISWGIALGTVLSLTLIPTIYLIVDDVKKLFARRK